MNMASASNQLKKRREKIESVCKLPIFRTKLPGNLSVNESFLRWAHVHSTSTVKTHTHTPSIASSSEESNGQRCQLRTLVQTDFNPRLNPRALSLRVMAGRMASVDMNKEPRAFSSCVQISANDDQTTNCIHQGLAPCNEHSSTLR